MQVTETSSEGLRREFKVVLAANDIDQKVSGRLTELAGQVRVPGFRPGKAPVSLLRKRFGPSVLGEVLQEAVQSSTTQALGEKGLRPAMRPEISIGEYEEGKDLEYTMAVEVMPEISPMDFKTLKLERRVVAVGDKEVNDALGRMAEDQKRTEPVDEVREAKSGETVVIDFVGKVGGSAFEGGAGENFSLELGSGTFIPGFEDQLVGAKAGEEREVTVSFPDDYPKAELAGKEAVFDVAIKELRAPVEAAIDDDLAKQMGLEDLEALKTAVRQRIEEEYGQFSRQRLKRELLDGLADNHAFEIPAGMKKVEFDQIWAQLREELDRSQSDGEESKDKDALREDYEAIAERRVRLGLLLSEVGRINNIQVSGEDLNRAVMQEARKYPGQERQVFEFYQKNEQALNGLRAPIFEEKVVDFILELAEIQDVDSTLEDLLDMPDEDGAPARTEGGKAAGGSKSKAKAKSSASKADGADKPDGNESGSDSA